MHDKKYGYYYSNNNELIGFAIFKLALTIFFTLNANKHCNDTLKHFPGDLRHPPGAAASKGCRGFHRGYRERPRFNHD